MLIYEYMKKQEIDYKDINLTEKDKKKGWAISHCAGNTHKRGCGKPYRMLSWFNPSGCPHCHATFVD